MRSSSVKRFCRVCCACEERFGADYVSLVLVGSQEQRIVSAGHDQVEHLGASERLPPPRCSAMDRATRRPGISHQGRRIQSCARDGRGTPFACAANVRRRCCARETRARRALSSNAVQAFPLFDKGLSVEQVAEQLGRAVSTSFGYLEAYIRQRRVTDATRWISPHEFERIDAAVEQHGGERLRPIFDALQGSVPFERIRIAMACLANRAVDAEAATAHESAT